VLDSQIPLWSDSDCCTRAWVIIAEG
jgi:hypothetical protein